MQLTVKKLVLAGFSLGLTLPATALDIPDAVGGSDCLACHAPTSELVGPSLQSLAKKYKGRSTAGMVKALRKGGKGHRAHPYLSQSEAEKAMNWIKGLKDADFVEKDSGEEEDSTPAGLKIMQGSDCLACHKQSGKLVGPSFDDIKKKYGKADVAGLAKKVIEGGSGVWGALAMTPHAGMSTEDATSAVEYILGLGAAPAKKAASKKKAAPKAEKKAAAPAKKAAAPEKKASSAVDPAKAKALLNGSDCMACHQATAKVVGPSWKMIAEKYGKDGDVAPIAKKIKEGGSGAWGAMPMTPHPNFSDEELNTMVKYILSF